MGKESMTEAARVEADYAKAATQLKTAQGKEDAALKAEEAEKTAALKAEHSASGGKTGLLAKLTGHEDPALKAESQHLKAEINRANQQTKAAHTSEKAELDAERAKELAAAQAADKLRTTGVHNNAAAPGALNHGAAAPGAYSAAAPGALNYNAAAPGAYNAAAVPGSGVALNNAGGSYAPSNYNAAPGAHINPNAYGSTAAAAVGPQTAADKKIYNHATGTYGQAALDDGRRQDEVIYSGHNTAQQQFVPQGIAAVPVVMAAQPVMGVVQQPMVQQSMGVQQPMMGQQSTGVQPVGVIQPSGAR